MSVGRASLHSDAARGVIVPSNRSPRTFDTL